MTEIRATTEADEAATRDTPPRAVTTPTAGRARRVRPRWRAWLAGVGLAAVALGASACLSGAGVEDDVLSITGSSVSDFIVLRLRAGDPNTLEVDDGADGSVQYAFDRQTFTSIVVDGAGGDDVVTVDPVNGVFTDVESTVLIGGEGNDTLIGEIGGERLEGGPGDDVLDGNRGGDVVVGGDDADVVQWDPGDGSDAVDGGAGADRLVFNGGNVGELVEVSAVGDRVRLTRNVGSVVQDLDGVEAVDLRVLGGADVVTVHDVAGTDLAAVDTDLAATVGGDDAQVDEVVVPPGLRVGRDGAAAVVDGLGARVRVLNGSPTDRIRVTGTAAVDVVSVVGTAGADTVGVFASGTDVVVDGATPGVVVALTAVERLEVDLAAGDDTFSTAGNVAALVALGVDGGVGGDTLRGGNGADLLDGGPGDDLVDGNQGGDVVVGGDDADVVQWDPGDGSDAVDGGAGADRLVFNGGNVGELVEVSAVGDRVRLTRNVGSVVQDLDGVEAVDLRVLGGADVVTVHDVAGTDLAAVDTDLAATVGGAVADGVGDQVVVNGTSGADTVMVSAAGSAVETTGLAATVRVTGADATVDRLTVNGLAGADTTTATPGAGALILLDLVP